MPTFDYICINKECAHTWEDFHSPKESIKECPECHQQTAERQIGRGSVIILKGSGFYAVDYKKKVERRNDANPLLHVDEATDDGGVAAV